jgi:secreted PhoX family phosphatase
MSELRRRSVIAGTAAAAAAGTATVTASPAQAAKATTDLLSRSRFSPLVGSTFTMSSATGSSTVVLSAVGDLVPGGSPGSDRQFAASFTGASGGPARADGVYTFSRKGFTATALFVVAAADGTHWRATVNRV